MPEGLSSPESRFGELKEARRIGGGVAIERHEQAVFPKTRIVLNSKNKAGIKSFFDIALTDKTLRIFYDNIMIIYAVDGDGCIILAVEELFESYGEGIREGTPRLVKHRPHEGLPKLGHPSLLPIEDKRARLCGEIRYKNGVWRANHYSGRYRGDKKCLGNLVKEFSKYDILIREFED